jgi:hypothetical protein
VWGIGSHVSVYVPPITVEDVPGDTLQFESTHGQQSLFRSEYDWAASLEQPVCLANLFLRQVYQIGSPIDSVSLLFVLPAY